MGHVLCHREGCYDSLNYPASYWPWYVRKHTCTHAHTSHTPHNPASATEMENDKGMSMLNKQFVGLGCQEAFRPTCTPNPALASLSGESSHAALSHSDKHSRVWTPARRPVWAGLPAALLSPCRPRASLSGLGFLICPVGTGALKDRVRTTRSMSEAPSSAANYDDR